MQLMAVGSSLCS